MPELRLNLLTREWVIVEKNTAVRPTDFLETNVVKKLPDYVGTCHFCAGNEDIIPDELYRIQDEKGWKVRVVRNKFSRLSEEGPQTRWGDKLQRAANGVGIHEIIIETPFHNLTTANLPVEQLKAVIETYKNRLVQIHNDPRVEYVVIFKNSGTTSGTSFEHSLTQMVGIPVMPLQMRDRIEAYMRFFDDTGECLMCKMLNEELQNGTRIIRNTEHFVSFIPYAALLPFHIWIFPKRHSGSISDLSNEEMWDLASNLKATMSRLYYGLENPDFNYAIRSGKPDNANSKFIHWYLSIVPRIGYTSGFEMASGMFINPIQPELSAKFLRDVNIPEEHT
ncbi:MAG: galactose-1-phosphate uridylyltransferase [Nitrospirae bacterium]|nr:galactose-1-phosphate uridylyltransferase [Nitrospirota bacterium]